MEVATHYTLLTLFTWFTLLTRFTLTLGKPTRKKKKCTYEKVPKNLGPPIQQFFLGKLSLTYPTSGPTGTNFFPLLKQCSNFLELKILYHIHILQNAKSTTECTASLARRVFDSSLLLDIFVPEEGCNTTNVQPRGK